MRRKRIGVVSFNVNHGLCYQRIHIPFRDLDPEKYEFRFFDLGDLRHSDAFYLDALIACHPWTLEYVHLLSRARFHYQLPVIVDIDDLVTELPSDHPDYASFRDNKLCDVLQIANHCVYSTDYIASRYGHLNRNHTVIENTISKRVYDAYRPQIKPYQNAFTAGWTGSQSHAPDIPLCVPGLQKFLRDNPVDGRAYFHILCPQHLLTEFGSQLVYEPNPCEFLDYPGVSAAYPFSACMVPLAPHPFNDAKSDLKLLEMAPHGIPLIASPRHEFIRHAPRNIMLFADDNDPNHKTWAEQLQWAYENPERMLEMGERARDYVMRERTSETAAARWDAVLTQVLSKE